MKGILPLAAVEVFVWVILLLSAFFISKIAFAINLGTGTLAGRIATETLRVLVSGGIAIAWLLIWKRIVDTYFWRSITRRQTTP